MENLNIALIGCGMIGREHIERIQNRIRGAQVVAVCDVFEEGAKKGAEIAGAGTKVYTDFNEAINDPDVNAVVVTTPDVYKRQTVPHPCSRHWRTTASRQPQPLLRWQPIMTVQPQWT